MILKQKDIQSAEFIKEVPMWQSSIAIPFVVLYVGMGFLAWNPELITDQIPADYIDKFHIKDRHVSGLSLLLIPLFVFVQVLIGLTTIWSPTTKRRVFFSSCRDIRSATHLFLKPRPHKGHPCIAIIRKNDDKMEVSHANRNYTWCPEKSTFIKPMLPTRLTIGEYRKGSSGLSRKAAADQFTKFGENKFVIPIPSFKVMLVEHATSPFFVFQMFCVLLWMLDDYWAMSLLTGVMLVMFEGTVVHQRIKNLHQLRDMETTPTVVCVNRQGSWTNIPSTQLVPGDVIQLGGSNTKKFEVPCDILLLEGSVVTNEALLTGETTPLVKEPITGRAADEQLCVKKDKTHIIFGGTTALQCIPTLDSPTGSKGPVGYVLRTGFETTQGALVRKIVDNSLASTTAGSGEALAFIACLLVFALTSSAYVLYHGLLDPLRSRYKLLLSCTIIVTSVVPPELPMELALAVNMSFLLLQRLRIFCTEPFRIPFAGALDTCCFDKTGTLTADVMVLQGTSNPLVEGSDSGPSKPTDLQKVVLGGCHSLLFLNNEICGDPMEKAGFMGSGWTMASNGSIEHPNHKGKPLTVITRFPFSAVLKRMSCIVRFNGQVYAVIKGAPEILKQFFTLSEDDQQKYDDRQEHLSKQGFRVIAIGMAKMKSHVTDIYAKRMKRSDLEAAEFDFLGFAVFACPIREDAYTTISSLKGASQRMVMITGDNTNTAAYVAKELKMFRSEKSDYQVLDTPEAIASLLSSGSSPDDLIVSGDAFPDSDTFVKFLRKLVTNVTVFARCNPDQKEDIVVALNETGSTTLMCGDGTNDVGALSHAHVGVGLLAGCTSAKPIEKVQDDRDPLSIPEPLPEDMGFISIFKWKMREKARVQKLREKLTTEYSRAYTKAIANRKQPPPPPSFEGLRIDGGIHDEGDYCSVVQLGDASMAAPFTAKNSSTKACCHLLRLGRCTLVTTLQMYRVMALNCLSSAFSLSVLTNEGIKCSDSQMTVTSLVVTVCFLCMSRSTPSPELSEKRPHTKVFCPYIILTIIAQFSIHLYAILEARKLVFSFATDSADGVLPERENFDAAEFKPCLMNSVLFLLCNWQLVFIFVANYQGAPYMTSLTENAPMLYCLLALSLFVVECTLQSTGIASYLEFVDLWQYEGLVDAFLVILVANAIAVVAVDRVLGFIFRSQ